MTKTKKIKEFIKDCSFRVEASETKEEIEAFQKKEKTKGLFLYEGKIFLTYEMLICAKNIEEAEIQLREYIEKLC